MSAGRRASSFPRSGLALVACLALALVACGGGPAASDVAERSIHLRDFAFDPAAVAATGGRLTLAVTNDGPSVHNLTVRDADGTILVASKDLGPGMSQVISTRLEPGRYVFLCSIAGHEALGMAGTVTVTEP